LVRSSLLFNSFVDLFLFCSLRKYVPNHFDEMVAFHQRQDQQLPPDLFYFIGDSYVQGLAVQSITLSSVNLGIGSDTTDGVLRRLTVYKSLVSAKAIFLLLVLMT
jgi:hypothetical protein